MLNYIDDSYTPPPTVEGIDYYLDPKGYRVMTEYFLTNRGYCCGNGCRHCPYSPSAQKGNTVLKEKSR